MNKAILIGRPTKKPDTRYTQGQQAMAISRFTLAVDRKIKKDNEQSADFISCIAFSKTAEFIEKYIDKGTKICVEGKIQTGSYKNKDGQTVYTTDVIVDNVEFCESKGGSKTDDGFLPNGDDEALPFN